MLGEGCWPMCWRVHWIIPIYKRKAVSDPSNYRGVHLTTLLSKVAERIINSLMTPFLQKTGAFGTPQFAFQKGLSANDLIAYLVCYWILCLTNREKIGIYLSDISGAFDKVEKVRLMQKLANAGLNDNLVNLLQDYLSIRAAYVLSNGEKSEQMGLENTVFQGTVLGPTLWNVSFKDITDLPELADAVSALFADDLSITTAFSQHTSNAEIKRKMGTYQDATHR